MPVTWNPIAPLHRANSMTSCNFNGGKTDMPNPQYIRKTRRVMETAMRSAL